MHIKITKQTKEKKTNDAETDGHNGLFKTLEALGRAVLCILVSYLFDKTVQFDH